MKYFTAKAANKTANKAAKQIEIEIGVDLSYDDNMSLNKILDIIKVQANSGMYSHMLHGCDYTEDVLNMLTRLGYKFEQHYSYSHKDYDMGISW